MTRHLRSSGSFSSGYSRSTNATQTYSNGHSISTQTLDSVGDPQFDDDDVELWCELIFNGFSIWLWRRAESDAGLCLTHERVTLGVCWVFAWCVLDVCCICVRCLFDVLSVCNIFFKLLMNTCWIMVRCLLFFFKKRYCGILVELWLDVCYI